MSNEIRSKIYRKISPSELFNEIVHGYSWSEIEELSNMLNNYFRVFPTLKDWELTHKDIEDQINQIVETVSKSIIGVIPKTEENKNECI